MEQQLNNNNYRQHLERIRQFPPGSRDFLLTLVVTTATSNEQRVAKEQDHNTCLFYVRC